MLGLQHLRGHRAAVQIALQAPAAIAAQPVANGAEQYARGRILVMPRAGLSETEFAKALAPRSLVPIHSFAPERFGEMFDSVTPRRDGEWWDI